MIRKSGAAMWASILALVLAMEPPAPAAEAPPDDPAPASAPVGLIAGTATAIVPLIVGGALMAEDQSPRLEAAGFIVMASGSRWRPGSRTASKARGGAPRSMAASHWRCRPARWLRWRRATRSNAASATSSESPRRSSCRWRWGARARRRHEPVRSRPSRATTPALVVAGAAGGGSRPGSAGARRFETNLDQEGAVDAEHS